jgi:hypothetical protein
MSKAFPSWKMAKSRHGAKRSMNCVIRPHSGTTGHDDVTMIRHCVTPANWTPAESSAGVTA